MKTTVKRTLSVLFGWLIWSFSVIVTNFSISVGIEPPLLLYLLWIVGLSLSIYGFYLWAELKGYSKAYMLMGIITPISILIFALMDNKKSPVSRMQKFIESNCIDCLYFKDSVCTLESSANIHGGYCYSFKSKNTSF